MNAPLITLRTAVTAALITTLAACLQPALDNEVATSPPFQAGGVERPGDIETSGSDNETPEINSTAVTGLVRDAWGAPIPDVRITTNTGAETFSDHNGYFRFAQQVGDTDLLISYRKDGWARTQRPLHLWKNADHTILQSLARVDFVQDFDSAEGLTFQIEEGGAVVTLPGGNLVDENGVPYLGEAHVEATWFDLESPLDEGNELFATPGQMLALGEDGQELSLESFGMFQVDVFDSSDQPLLLGDLPATFEVPILDLGSADEPEADDEVRGWRYDETLGLWLEQGLGTVSTDPNGELSWTIQAQALETWNIDEPIETHGCVSGRVLDPWGEVRSGVTLRVVGESYSGWSEVITQDDGSYCVQVKHGERGFIEYNASFGGEVATQRTDSFLVPIGQTQCPDFVWTGRPIVGGQSSGSGWGGGGGNGGGGDGGGDGGGGGDDIHGEEIPPELDDEDFDGGNLDPQQVSGPRDFDPTTDANGCLQLPDVLLQIQTCVGGVVVDEQSRPIEGAQVVSPQGGVATSDSNGSFLLTVPVFRTTEVYGLPESQFGQGLRPARVFTRPALPNGAGGCPNQVVLRPFEETRCATGRIIASTATDGILVSVFDSAFPASAVTTAMTNAEGAFQVDLPVTGGEVIVAPGGQLASQRCDVLAVSPTAVVDGTCIDLGDLNCL